MQSACHIKGFVADWAAARCRILRPVGTLVGWALGAAGILNVLHAVGLNIQPLVAAGGVSGIALGFGAQKLTQNVLSGAKLVAPPPPPLPPLPDNESGKS